MYEKIPPCLHYAPSDHLEPCSCLDSAYEREAIKDGFQFDVNDLFPENVNVYIQRQTCSKGS